MTPKREGIGSEYVSYDLLDRGAGNRGLSDQKQDLGRDFNTRRDNELLELIKVPWSCREEWAGW